MKSRTRIGVTQTQRLQLSGSLATALKVLEADAATLTRMLEEQAAETPALRLSRPPPAAGDWLPRWRAALHGSAGDEVEAVADQGPSLAAHVIAAIPRLVGPGQPRRIAFSLADALEPSGWLGRPLAAIASDLGVREAEVEEVLRRLQGIEPAGLFARNLAECLELQARAEGLFDPVMSVVLGNLPLLAAGDWAELARRAATGEDEIRLRLRRIRGFDPKPGAAFSALASPVREPDLTARRTPSGWEVALNRTSLPALAVDAGAEGAARARALIRLIERRNATLLAVGQTVLTRQAGALEAGPGALRPLTMQEVAEELSLSRSTVSRVVAGTAVDTPQGTWWLRALFSADMGGEAGAAALRARLARMVAEEDAAHPLSDLALAEALSEGGVSVARRTVAKYREALRIPPAHRRRAIGRARRA
jgi:RNA polymerase sigma-54 factor